MRQVNEQLKDLLQKTGVKQYFLAYLMGMNEVRLSRIVHGRANPTADEKAKIADFFKVDEEQLFDGGGSNAANI